MPDARKTPGNRRLDPASDGAGVLPTTGWRRSIARAYVRPTRLPCPLPTSFLAWSFVVETKAFAERAGPGDSDRRISGSLAPTNGCVSSHHRSKSMARRTRRNHTPAFKAQVALAALKSDKTLAELAQQDDIHPNQITDWKRPLTEHAVQVFGDARSPASSDPDLTKRHAKIGQWTLENDFLEHALTQAGLLSARRGLTATISSLYRISAPCLGWLVRACTTRHARSRRRTSR